MVLLISSIGDPNIDLVLLGENTGFASACNRGAARGSSSFVLFLNPDARLLEQTMSQIDGMTSDPSRVRVGVFGARLVHEDGSTQRSCARFPGAKNFVASSFGISRVLKLAGMHMHDWDHADTRLVDHVIGAFYLIRRELFERLGGFDERFFVYLEDLDLSLRVHNENYQVLYLADVVAFHKGGGVSERVKAHRLFYSLRSRIQYAFKHFSAVDAILVAASTLFVEPFSRLVLAISHGSLQEVIDLCRGYRMLLGWAISAVWSPRSVISDRML
ncbi:glycosyl transferase [Cereibacter changlensis JA139]|uniref:Glycosyl transferase n=1 Tax=Cereibacter changlensis JA139 TaxID=1188249 RepID=A0A2T4JP45_9RHOB|nr:glycosyltransferase family 2 protein [Cereibacter changlensis]PTE19680.1 glycosyl transferase [Cereibacter changlensis JA139]